MAKQILAHAAASTTVNIYEHVLEGAKPEAIAALDRMLRGRLVGGLVANRVAKRLSEEKTAPERG